MTIDEVISIEKQTAEFYKNSLQASLKEDSYEYGILQVTIDRSNKIIDCLEELKEARKGFEENRKAGYKRGYSDGYNKAIDDCLKILKENIEYIETDEEDYRTIDIESILLIEQLKEGVNNADDR